MSGSVASVTRQCQLFGQLPSIKVSQTPVKLNPAKKEKNMLFRKSSVVGIFGWLVVGGLGITTLNSCGKEVVNGRDKERFEERLDRIEQRTEQLEKAPTPQGEAGPAGGTGPAGSAGPSGLPGQQGATGSAGRSAAMAAISVLGIDRSLPWTTSNHSIITQLTRVEVYLAFSVAAMLSPASNPQNHWVDIDVGGTVFCYQRRTASVWYDLIYRKVAGALTGCDSNSDKNLGAWPNSATVPAGGVVRVIPRDPKLNGVIWDLVLNTWEIQ